jgi:hypothetical protein
LGKRFNKNQFIKERKKLKERSFKFRESFGKAIAPMTDKQAGRLIKGLCIYAFNGKLPDNKDGIVQSGFELMKTALDAEERDRQNGRIGGIISAEKGRKRGGVLVITETKEQSCPMEKILRDILSDTAENSKESGEKTVAKTQKRQAG